MFYICSAITARSKIEIALPVIFDMERKKKVAEIPDLARLNNNVVKVTLISVT